MTRFIFFVIGVHLALALVTIANEPARTLRIDTGRSKDGVFTLAGRDAWQQLLVTGAESRDLTHSVAYATQPTGIVQVDATGLVTPLKDGKATITAKTKDGSAAIQVVVTNMIDELPINFANQIVPIFTKFGCNAGGCHGKASGQNGFKLSLLGFEPEDDYEYLVKENRGRRILTTASEHSMLLLKAAGGMPHGGGRKLDVDSPYYRLIQRWIEQGTPYGRTSDPVVTRIEVLPRFRVLQRGGKQQLAVVAHRSDGTTVDVTRMTQFETNEKEIASVTDTGLVHTLQTPGTVAIMARFQTHVDVFRAMVPLGADVAKLPPAKNFIDDHVFAQLKKLGVPPSELCDDATFIRRVTLDIAGRLPTLSETEQFLASKDPARQEQLVDALLASKDYADYFAGKWSAVLRNRRKSPTDDSRPTFAFHAWIRESLDKNTPYDQVVRDVLTATGEEIKTPPVQWYAEVKDASAQLEDMAQLFLGQRIGCAKCHHHPLEKWSQHDYWGLAACFSRVQIKERGKTKKKGEPPAPLVVSLKATKAEAMHPRTKVVIKPTGLGSDELPIGAADDPRHKLVDWMTKKDNPFFARTLVNRYWKHFFNRGLVEPEDDLRVTNPPTNPELLDALAAHFVESKYDLKKLVRAICTSNAYRLSSIPNAQNADDKQNYSRFLPRRLPAEVLFDAIDAVTLSKPVFKGVPAGTRAVQLPDNQFESYFLSVFGRPDFASACECERSSDSNLAQYLLFYNSNELMKKIGGPRAQKFAADKRSHDDRVRELYLTALSRLPTEKELLDLRAYLSARPQGAQSAYEDVLWALLNTKEFLFNH
ncbi:MAG: DUF1553 domain-containing protein [Planctomycetes bacterium]|nr:DUF1553 domain-containing protein [Planctomycetota bacterium]